MRLKPTEQISIKEVFVRTFNHGALYLFGSRVDDNQNGGDIDLYIIPTSTNNLSVKKIDFLVQLKRAIGEQKIDVVIDRGLNRTIDQVAMRNGVLLCQN